MPKETISAHPGANAVELRWDGMNVQVATTGQSSEVPPETADAISATLKAGRIQVGMYPDRPDGEDDGGFGGWIEDEAETWILYYDRKMRPVVMWTERDEGAVVEGSAIDLTEHGAARKGWFVSLDRSDINRLIESLRRARNAVFGKDA